MRLLSTLGIACALAACSFSTVREDDFPRYTISTQAPLDRIETSVGSFEFRREGGGLLGSGSMGRLQKEAVVSQWIASDRVAGETFREEGSFSGEAAYELTFSGSVIGTSNVLWDIVHVLTLFLVPTSVDTTLYLTVERRDVTTGEVTVARARQRNKTLQSLVFVLTSPFQVAGDYGAASRLSNSLYCQLWPDGCQLEAHAPH